MVILYFLIGLFATVLGSIAGLGGGVIIKPLLDFLGHYDVGTISVLSAAAVFSMATVSMLKARMMKIKLDKTISLLIAIGSIMGGILGKGIFNYLVNTLDIADVVSVFQSAVLALLMIAILILTRQFDKVPHVVIQNKVGIIGVGTLLGLLSAFLGIGGGPLNVIILGLLFSMAPKEASFNSIFIIFFSQLSSLILTGLDTGFAVYDLSVLGYMIVGGVMGGWIGTSFSKFISDQQVRTIFSITIFIILLINVNNIFSL
ncbi:sulfite exporter TauE/SafE family protein [Amphibacillus sp. Q70]|uniref:sulfite exporter TauE/SafE family protein n=1 Tax=Amphibacillus sp. Q70 TaxID=3453416 RepID=UPI003F87FA05